MMEVMISIIVLSFGLLGMGGLQLAALRSNQMSGNFSTAATLAREYTEIMRSNPTVSNIVTTTAGVNPYLFDSSSLTASTVNCVTATCTTANLATLQVKDWATRVQGQLPGGRAVVCRDTAPRNGDGSYTWSCNNTGTFVTVKIGWTDRRENVERGTTTLTATPLNPQLITIGYTGLSGL